jgi:hypothetical protein
MRRRSDSLSSSLPTLPQESLGWAIRITNPPKASARKLAVTIR